MHFTHRVLIACGTNWNSSARLPRVLRDAGCHVSVLCAPESALAQTKFINTLIPAASELDPFIEQLRIHLSERGAEYSWVIVADDPLLTTLAERREDWISPWFPVDSRSDAIRWIASKAGFVQAATKARLPLPESRVCVGLDEVKQAAREIGIPVILKKSVSYAGLGVRAVMDANELESGFIGLGKEPGEVVVQRFIGGAIGNTIALFDHGRPLTWVSSYKARTWPGPFGPSCARRFMNHESVAPIVAGVGALTGFHGIGAIDWVEDEATGALVILEFNARPVPAIHLAPHGGVNFAIAIAAMLSGQGATLPPPEMPTNAPVVPMFPEDFYRAVTEGDRAALDGFRTKAGGRDDIPFGDPPLLAYLLRGRTMRRWFTTLFGENHSANTSY